METLIQESVLNSPNGNMSNNSMLSNSSQFLNTPIKSPNDKEDDVINYKNSFFQALLKNIFRLIE